MKDLMENNLPESINRLMSRLHDDDRHIDEPDDLESEIDFSYDPEKMRRKQVQDYIIDDEEINEL